MDKYQRNQLVDALLAIRSIKDNDIRNDIKADLPLEIQGSLSMRTSLKADVIQLVTTCLSYPEGMDILLETTLYYEENTIPMMEAIRVWKRITTHQQLISLFRDSFPEEYSSVREHYCKSLPLEWNADPTIEKLEDIFLHLESLPNGVYGLHPVLIFLEQIAAYSSAENLKLSLQSWTDKAIQTVYTGSRLEKLYQLRKELADERLKSSAHPDIDHVLISQNTLQERTVELGKIISDTYQGKDLLMVYLLKESRVFINDLSRAIGMPHELDSMSVSNSHYVRIHKDLEVSIANRNVLLVGGILDTGIIHSHIARILRERNPASFRILVLLDKPGRREVNCPIDWVGFSIPDEVVVGYGFDYKGLYHDLPYIGVLKPDIISKL